MKTQKYQLIKKINLKNNLNSNLKFKNELSERR